MATCVERSSHSSFPRMGKRRYDEEDESYGKRRRWGADSTSSSKFNWSLFAPQKDEEGREVEELKEKVAELRRALHMQRQEAETAVRQRESALHEMSMELGAAKAEVSKLQKDKEVLKRAVSVQATRLKEAEHKSQTLEYDLRIARSTAQSLYTRNQDLDRALRQEALRRGPDLFSYPDYESEPHSDF